METKVAIPCPKSNGCLPLLSMPTEYQAEKKDKAERYGIQAALAPACLVGYSSEKVVLLVDLERCD